jgi:hypothetical protein
MGIEYQPICDVLANLAESAREIADDFFMHHTRLEQHAAATPGDRPANRLSLIAKDAIGRDQQRQLAKLLCDIERLSGSTRNWRELRSCIQTCRQTLQGGSPYRESAYNHFQAFGELTDQIIQIARGMVDDTPNKVILVPDIQAVLDFPELETWTFAPFETFDLVVPATMFCELQELQNGALDQVSWKKSAKALDQLQEYFRRRRGSEAATIADGRIRLSIRQIEPMFDEAVGWLDPASAEDRTVARVIGLIREHPRCVVALVTRDTKLQNRADDSRIDTIEPSVVASPARGD